MIFSTKTKFNLKRHTSRKHQNLPEVISLKTNPPSIENNKRTLEQILIDIGLGELALKFESEKVDLNMLISMPKDDFKTLLVDFDLKWGERYKLEKAIAL